MPGPLDVERAVRMYRQDAAVRPGVSDDVFRGVLDTHRDGQRDGVLGRLSATLVGRPLREGVDGFVVWILEEMGCFAFLSILLSCM